MRTQKISFPDQQTLCVFPDERSNLEQAISELGLERHYPVIVLIGGEIDKQYAAVVQQAVQTISGSAQDLKSLVICGGTNMGIMSEIGHTRKRNQHNFPMVGVAPEELVSWPGGPQNAKFLWLQKQRWQLEPHYTHFILVPGSKFGDESSWIVDTATLLSQNNRSVTILIGGGDVSRKDIELSLEKGRPVIALSRTGHLADELGRLPVRNPLITIIPGTAGSRIIEAVQAALSMNEKSSSPALDIQEKVLNAG